MNAVWWVLPGPETFVNRVVEDLSDGRNCVLCLPSIFPKGLRATVDQRAQAQGLPSLDVIYGAERGERPLDLLWQMYGGPLAPSALRGLEDLLKTSEFQGQLVWTECRSQAEWSDWKDFISQYQQAGRSVPLNQRTVFCVAVYGMCALDPPSEDVCLAIHKWTNVISGIDSLLYASRLLRERRTNNLQFEVAARVVADLALWDPSVAELLAQEPLESILNPASVLEAIALERGWQEDRDQTFDHKWALGKADYAAGRQTTHPAALSSDNRSKRIMDAVWSAEVGVFFPMLERRRQELVRKLQPFLRVPFVTRFGEQIDDLLDLEIGHIESQIWHRRAKLDPALLEEVACLREIRNRLSHLETVPIESLLSVSKSWG